MGENTRKDRRTKVLSMTVRYRSATLGEFIEHHSYDVSRGGMFIKTPSPFPPGTLLKFEVKIADEQRVMQGVGRVVWKRDRDGVGSDEPAGMGIKFIKIDEASRAVIDRLVGERGADEAGAFEKPPASIPHMFPAGSLEPPEPHDRTVMKSADQLLQDALEKTGETAESSASFDLVRERVSSVPSARGASDADSSGGVERGNRVAAQNERDSTEHGPGKRPSDNSPSGRRETSASAPRAATSFPPDDAEGGGGRAVLAILAAVIVAGGIYIAAKRAPGDQSVRPATSGAVAPSLVAPPALAPAPIDPAPQPSAPRDPSSLGHGPAAGLDPAGLARREDHPELRAVLGTRRLRVVIHNQPPGAPAVRFEPAGLCCDIEIEGVMPVAGPVDRAA